MRKPLIFLGTASVAMSIFMVAGCKKNDKTDNYTDGKLEVSIRNLYFNDYTGGDRYLEEIEDKFKLSFKLSAYDWANWETQVIGQVNGGETPDVFHANIDSYNFANLYKFWAEEEVIKPLPTDLTKWPNIKKLIDNTSNVESLKIDGKLYGLPIAKNTTDYSTTFSPFTYIYRRDWAKKYGVYKENDEYTWAEFKHLMDVFEENLNPSGKSALADVEWGYPSIVNFYKQVPHCFAQDLNTGKYVNNYTTDAYIEGLEESKSFVSNNYYYASQYSARDGDMNIRYYSNQVGVFFENLSYANYFDIKEHLKQTNASVTNFNVEDAAAIMKIKGPDGKYALEGTDNWFSMSFFDYRISDEKQTKILDLLDWLLSEEGTNFSVYGFEGYDYVKDGDTITLNEEYWPKNIDGTYARKNNGGKYLRNIVSLGYDTLKYDPLTDKASVNYLESWEAEMKEAENNGDLRVLKENAEVMWLTTPQKSNFSGSLRTDALNNVKKYIHNKDLHTIQDFKNTFSSKWTDVLNEINTALGK